MHPELKFNLEREKFQESLNAAAHSRLVAEAKAAGSESAEPGRRGWVSRLLAWMRLTPRSQALVEVASPEPSASVE